MQNKVLRTMLLDVNLIGDSGAMSIAQALEHNTALVKLDLWDNKIGDKGAVSLARALEKNTVLTTLDLGINKITDTGATAIAAALQVNTVVTELKLEGNTGIDEGIVASIEASLAENRDPVKREAKIKAAKEIVKARATALTTQAAGEGRMCGRPEFITHRNIPPDCKGTVGVEGGAKETHGSPGNPALHFGCVREVGCARCDGVCAVCTDTYGMPWYTLF